jgi:hypothetical protein
MAADAAIHVHACLVDIQLQNFNQMHVVSVISGSSCVLYAFRHVQQQFSMRLLMLSLKLFHPRQLEQLSRSIYALVTLISKAGYSEVANVSR